MARSRRGQARPVTAALGFLLALWTGLAASAADCPARALLYERAVLVVDPGMHTAPITSTAVDAAGQFAVTGSYDRTVRIWSVANGKLLHTIRMPAGPGNTGRMYAVAITSDGTLVA